MLVQRPRIFALDVFRGLTVALMLLVNNPGTWAAVYPPLRHAEWHGWTPTDMVFPFFLFIVGVTTHLSIAAARDRGVTDRQLVAKVLRRGALIVLAGLLLNAFPFYWWGKIPGIEAPTLLERVIWRFDHLRLPGVLQRIGIVYMIAALVALRAPARVRAFVTGVLLFGYWFVMTRIPVPDTGTTGLLSLQQGSTTMAAWIDRLVIGEKHLWSLTKTWDPEGVLSTLPAIATALLGGFAGERLTSDKGGLPRRTLALYAVGVLGIIAGVVWGLAFPINKNLWTSSYAVFTAGFAAVVLATCIWTTDVLKWTWWTRPFVIFGVNPLVAFVGSGVMARLLTVIQIDMNGQKMTLQRVIYEWVFSPWFIPEFASLLYALTFVAIWLGILGLMHRHNLIVKL